MFAGASGTGKTMVVEVLADHLRLDLYRIALSQVVSKYVRETKNKLRTCSTRRRWVGRFCCSTESTRCSAGGGR